MLHGQFLGGNGQITVMAFKESSDMVVIILSLACKFHGQVHLTLEVDAIQLLHWSKKNKLKSYVS